MHSRGCEIQHRGYFLHLRSAIVGRSDPPTATAGESGERMASHGCRFPRLASKLPPDTAENIPRAHASPPARAAALNRRTASRRV